MRERRGYFGLGLFFVILDLEEGVECHSVLVPFQWRYGLRTRERLVVSLAWECDWVSWELQGRERVGGTNETCISKKKVSNSTNYSVSGTAHNIVRFYDVMFTSHRAKIVISSSLSLRDTCRTYR